MKTTKFLRLTAVVLVLACAVLQIACSENATDNRIPLLNIASTLKTKSTTGLSGTINVYDLNDTLITSEDLIFTADQIYSPTLTLRKGEIYRLILIFYYEDTLPIAFLDEDITLNSDDTQSFTLHSENIVFAMSDITNTEVLAALTTDVDTGILPDLDLDDDGYSNDSERRGGSDAYDPASIPSGPTFSTPEVTYSEDGNLITVTTTLKDGNRIAGVTPSFENANYLVYGGIVTETLSGDNLDTARDYTLSFNPQYAPIGTLGLTLSATNSLGLIGTESVNLTIADNAVNVGPVIVFDSLNTGAIISGEYEIDLSAYDRDGVQTLTLTSPTSISDTADSADKFSGVWDTTTQNDGSVSVTATSTDLLGNKTKRTIKITINNGTDASGPQLQMIVSPPDDSSSEIDYLNGDPIYGVVRFSVSANDASSVSLISLINSQDLHCGPTDFTNCPLTNHDFDSTSAGYSNYLDVTGYNDGDIIDLMFEAKDEYGNTSERIFTLTVKSIPTTPEDPAVAPSFSDVNVVYSSDGNLITVTTTISDDNYIKTVVPNIAGLDYLTAGGIMTTTLSGETSDTERTYTLSFNPQYAPIGDLNLKLTATNNLGLTSNTSTTITISDNGVNVSPVIVFDSLSDGAVISGDYTIKLSAYDRDGIQSLTLTSPTLIMDTDSLTESFSGTWETTAQSDGSFTVIATSTDLSGNTATRKIIISINNGSDVSGPQLLMTVNPPEDSSLEIDYLNGQTVYGVIQLNTVARDAGSVDSITLKNSKDLGCGPTDYTDCTLTSHIFTTTSSSYSNYLDTTSYADDDRIDLTFAATDENGNFNEKTFTLTVKNHPAINSVTESATTVLTDDQVTISYDVEARTSAVLVLDEVGEQITCDEQSLSDGIGDCTFTPNKTQAYTVRALYTTKNQNNDTVQFYTDFLTDTITSKKYWHTSSPLTDGSNHTKSPDMAMDGLGNAIIIWSKSNYQIYSLNYRDGDWGAQEAISSEGLYVHSAQVAMDANDNAIIVWRQSDGSNNRIYMSEYRDGEWSSPTVISSSSTTAYTPKVAMDDNGNAVVVWQAESSGYYRIYKKEYRAGVWSSSSAISSSGISSSDHELAMDNGGNTIIIWRQDDGSGDKQVYKKEYRSGAWGSAAMMSSSGIDTDNGSPDLAMDDSGDAIVVWKQKNSTGNYILYRSEYRDGAWKSATAISSEETEAFSVHVEMDNLGNAILVWYQKDDSGSAKIYKQEYNDGTWGSIETMTSIESSSVYALQVDMNDNKNAIIAWYEKDGSGYYQAYAIQYKDGIWGSPESIASDLENFSDLDVAIDESGNSMAIWSQKDSSGYSQIYQSQYR